MSDCYKSSIDSLANKSSMSEKDYDNEETFSSHQSTEEYIDETSLSNSDLESSEYSEEISGINELNSFLKQRLNDTLEENKQYKLKITDLNMQLNYAEMVNNDLGKDIENNKSKLSLSSSKRYLNCVVLPIF